jgi:hypothetical protein
MSKLSVVRRVLWPLDVLCDLKQLLAAQASQFTHGVQVIAEDIRPWELSLSLQSSSQQYRHPLHPEVATLDPSSIPHADIGTSKPSDGRS